MYPDQEAIKYDLVLAYRVYPGVSKTPFIHRNNKLRLAETGLKTLKTSLIGLKAKCYFILDNCPDEFERMIKGLFDEKDVEIIRLSGEGNLATFGMQIDILLNQNYSDIVFFAEDDYVYRPMLIKDAVELLNKNRQVDFVTLYDHHDSYIMPIHTKHKYEIITFGNLHWRTSASTCLTFLTKKDTLKGTEDVFRSYSKGNWDSSLWFAITKFNIFNVYSFVKYLFTDPFFSKIIVKSWIHCFMQIVFGKKYRLWQPIPSIATHMEQGDLAPAIDWNKVVAEVDLKE